MRMQGSRRSHFLLAILLLGVAFFSSGCLSLNDPEASQEFRSDSIARVAGGQSFGQTFVSRRPSLDGILLWVSVDPAAPPADALIAELFHAPGETHPLAVSLVRFSEAARTSPLRLAFPPQAGPAGQSYYLSLKTSGGSFQVFGRGEDAYSPGQAFFNGSPVNADASFRLSYDYGYSAFLDDLHRLLADLWLVLPLVITLLLPGWLLLIASGYSQHLDWGERMGISIGLSLSLIPLLMLWTSQAGLRWNRTAVLFAGGAFCVLAAWAFGASLARSSASLKKVREELLSPGLETGDPPAQAAVRLPLRRLGLWYGLTLGCIFVFSLAIRLIMIRDLAGPAWVDSVHHALITRLIVEQGTFPSSYAPYLEIDSAGYHPGFHSILAVFHWLSGLDIPTAMLLLGQVFNALSVFAVYLFTKVLVHNRLAGVLAALIAGVFTPMPAYYTSWGRYTQLAGLLILPAALALLSGLQEDETIRGAKNIKWKSMLLAAVACGGLFLVHYRVLAFLACLLLSFLASQALLKVWRKAAPSAHNSDASPAKRVSSWMSLDLQVGTLALAAGLAVLLTLPWWPETLRTLTLQSSAAPGTSHPLPFADFTWSYLTSGLGKATLVLAGLGLIVALFQRKRFVFILILWVVLLFLIANVGSLGLPGSGFVNNTSVEIILFLPISVLGAFLLAQVIEALGAVLPLRWRPIFGAGLAAIAIALSFVGAYRLIPILNPVTLLLRQADRSALDWVQAHLPTEATVMINPFPWGYGLYAGDDGGFWITPMTGRKTIPPPVLYGYDSRTSTVQGINRIVEQVMQETSDAGSLHNTLKSAGIGYVFIGERGGILSPQALLESPLFTPLYSQNGVWVFGVK